VEITFVCLLVCALSLPVVPAQDSAGLPVFTVAPVKSTIKFAVKASVPLEGTFQKWDATFTATSTAVESVVLDIRFRQQA
jgi:polyisoprenoid-binding protein YceI